MWIYVDSDPWSDKEWPSAYVVCTHAEIIVSFRTRDWPVERMRQALKRAYDVADLLSDRERWVDATKDFRCTYDEFVEFVAGQQIAAVTMVAKRKLTAKRREEFRRVRHDLMLALIQHGVPHVCAAEGCGMTEGLHLDHIVPLSRGGTDDLDNLQFLCASHNAAKGDKTEPDRTRAARTL